MLVMFLTLRLASNLLWFLHCCNTFVESFSNGETIMSEEESSLETTTLSTIMEKDLPLDLYDIGYIGTWERFCDPEEIKKEFTIYPHYHELMQMRNRICDLRRQNLIDKNAILTFAVYKYCDLMRTRIDAFLEAFISKFSFGEEAKKMELLDEGPLMNFTECYQKAIIDFKRKCIGEANPYFDMFKPLLGRACFVEWLTMDDILKHIHEVCNGKWITDQFDWRPILSSIKYRDNKGNTGFTIGSSVSPPSTIVDLNRFCIDE